MGNLIWQMAMDKYKILTLRVTKLFTKTHRTIISSSISSNINNNRKMEIMEGLKKM
jgi:hypothetical protein